MGMARSMAVTETLGGDLFSRRLGGGGQASDFPPSPYPHEKKSFRHVPTAPVHME